MLRSSQLTGSCSDLVYWGKSKLRGFPLVLLRKAAWVSNSPASPGSTLTHVFWQEVKNKRWWCSQGAGVWAWWPSNAVQLESCHHVTHPSLSKNAFGNTQPLEG